MPEEEKVEDLKAEKAEPVKEEVKDQPQVEKDLKGRRIIRTDKEHLLDLMAGMKKDGFNHLSLVTAVDRRDFIEVVYHLHNLATNEIVEVKLQTKDSHVPSVSHIWSSANWDEREQYDLMGVVFDGHPRMKRILLPEGWVGHPLRKDYNLDERQYVNMDENGEDYATFDPGDGW